MEDSRTPEPTGAARTGRADLDPEAGTATVHHAWDAWKLATIGTLLVIVTALVGTWVVAHRRGSEPARATAAQSGAPVADGGRNAGGGASDAPPIGPVSLQAMIDACHRTASAQADPQDRRWEVTKEAVLGEALTAGLGAASGALAGGGQGTRKGAAIGGLAGMAAGPLYGINENHRHDEAYRVAYASCMHGRGFSE